MTLNDPCSSKVLHPPSVPFTAVALHRPSAFTATSPPSLFTVSPFTDTSLLHRPHPFTATSLLHCPTPSPHSTFTTTPLLPPRLPPPPHRSFTAPSLIHRPRPIAPSPAPPHRSFTGPAPSLFTAPFTAPSLLHTPLTYWTRLHKTRGSTSQIKTIFGKGRK